VPGSAGGEGGLAFAALAPGRGILVYVDEAGALVSQRFEVSGGTPGFDAPAPVDGALPLGEPSFDGATLVVPTADGLVSRAYDDAASAWGAEIVHVWADGAPIVPCAGAAFAGELAAIPAGPTCRMVLATRAGEGVWQPLPEERAWLSGLAPSVAGRPALAYVRLTDDAPAGRYFLAWRPWPDGALVISMSEGDDSDPGATSGRLRFIRATFLRNVWADLIGSPALSHAAGLDDSLRAAWVYAGNGQMQFNPFADGIIDVEMRDQDDYAYIKANLACSLTASCPR
jgi:hypothetical protein